MARGRKHVPVPSKSDTPVIAPPQRMSEAAAAEWRRVVPMLADAKTLSPMDIATLTIYCDAVVLYDQCQQHINQHGPVVLGPTGTPVKNPYLLAQRDAYDRLRTATAELGLTPSSRAKLGIGQQDDDGENLSF